MSVLVRLATVVFTVALGAGLSAAPVPKAADQKVAVAYIHAADEKGAGVFKKLLDAEGFTVELVAHAAAAKADFSKYGLVVIGSDTENSAWEDAAAVVKKSGKPVLGLGEGGYTFFGRDGLKLDIGAPHGAHAKDGADRGALPVDADKSPLWTAAAIPGGKSVTLYKSSGYVEIYAPKPPADVVLLGNADNSINHYTLIRQGDRFVFWGFTAGPDDMTADGRKLFIATCRYTAGLVPTKGK